MNTAFPSHSALTGASPRMSTGIAGLDDILGGGLTPQRVDRKSVV